MLFHPFLVYLSHHFSSFFSRYTKLSIWTLTEYSKIVYVDSDMIALQNVDELFERPSLSACPDVCPYFFSFYFLKKKNRE